MGRKPVHIDKNLLISAVAKVEKNGPLKNELSLGLAISAIVSPKDRPKPYSPTCVLSKLRAYQIPFLTKKGKRGRSTGLEPHINKKRLFSINKKILDKLSKCTPQQYQGRVRKIGKGSRTAAVQLKCLECSGYVMVEAKECEIEECPLWMFRPGYKRATLEKD